MSIKSTLFAKNLGNPLNTHNFIVQIPLLRKADTIMGVDMLVTATSFPSEKMQEYVMYYQGERVKFPSIPTNDGVWSCTIPEGEMAKCYAATQYAMNQNYNQISGIQTFWGATDKRKITIFARGLRSGSQDVPGIFGVELHGAYILERNQVSLSSGSVTQAWEWTVTFAYDWIGNSIVNYHPLTAPPIKDPAGFDPAVFNNQ
jgi:hypothetical protein